MLNFESTPTFFHSGYMRMSLVVLWSLTLRDKCRLGEFADIRPKRDEGGEWGRLHNEELHSLYRSPNIVRVNIEMGMSCSQNGGR